MARAGVVGVGMTTFGKHEHESLEELGAEAARSAIEDSGLDPQRIDLVVSSNVLGGGGAGQRILERTGLLGAPVVNVENACASGSTAVHLARFAVEAGQASTVLVIGAERMTGMFKGGITLERSDRPTAIGLTMAAIYALWAQRYAYDYGVPTDRLAEISVKNRGYGARNPLAMFREPVTLETVLASKLVADPLTLLQSCANSDGAAALVVTADSAASGYRTDPVWLIGSGLASGRPIAHDTDLGRLSISHQSGQAAFASAGLTADRVDVAEIHDAFTIGEVLATEALGLAAYGKALDETRATVNPSGGLLSKGHPVGATGVAQVVELTRQLRGEAGERQVKNASVGLAHTVGGGVGTLEAIASGTIVLST